MKKVNVYRIDKDCVEGEIKTIALSDVSYHEAVVYCQSRPVTRFVKYVITSPADGLCGNCQSFMYCHKKGADVVKCTEYTSL